MRRATAVLRGLLLVSVVSLAGCSAHRWVSANDARHRYVESMAAYRACLSENAANPGACESQRLVMESNEREYGMLRTNPEHLKSD